MEAHFRLGKSVVLAPRPQPACMPSVVSAGMPAWFLQPGGDTKSWFSGFMDFTLRWCKKTLSQAGIMGAGA